MRFFMTFLKNQKIFKVEKTKKYEECIFKCEFTKAHLEILELLLQRFED